MPRRSVRILGLVVVPRCPESRADGPGAADHRAPRGCSDAGGQGRRAFTRRPSTTRSQARRHAWLAAHGPPSMFDIYASGTIANVGAQAPMYDLLGAAGPADPEAAHHPESGHQLTISLTG